MRQRIVVWTADKQAWLQRNNDDGDLPAVSHQRYWRFLPGVDLDCLNLLTIRLLEGQKAKARPCWPG
jgi:hypothetical protein